MQRAKGLFLLLYNCCIVRIGVRMPIAVIPNVYAIEDRKQSCTNSNYISNNRDRKLLNLGFRRCKLMFNDASTIDLALLYNFFKSSFCNLQFTKNGYSYVSRTYLIFFWRTAEVSSTELCLICGSQPWDSSELKYHSEVSRQ